MPPELILGLFSVFAPIVRSIIDAHKAANNGASPTDEQVKAEFAANIDKYLAEGAAWRAAHPK